MGVLGEMIMPMLLKFLHTIFCKSKEGSSSDSDKSETMLKVRKAFRSGRPRYDFIVVKNKSPSVYAKVGDIVNEDGLYFIVKEVYAKQWVKIDG